MEGNRLVIDVVDGGQWTHREWRMLRYLGVDTKIIRNDTPLEELRDLDGLILSGGAARVGLTGELGRCADYLTLNIPILGICAGLQFMAGHYGGQAIEAPKPEFGAATINLSATSNVVSVLTVELITCTSKMSAVNVWKVPAEPEIVPFTVAPSPTANEAP